MRIITGTEVSVTHRCMHVSTGTMHSPETAAPNDLMELAYRLVVDDTPYIAKIPSRLNTLIVPIVEFDVREARAFVAPPPRALRSVH